MENEYQDKSSSPYTPAAEDDAPSKPINGKFQPARPETLLALARKRTWIVSPVFYIPLLYCAFLYSLFLSAIVAKIPVSIDKQFPQLYLVLGYAALFSIPFCVAWITEILNFNDMDSGLLGTKHFLFLLMIAGVFFPLLFIVAYFQYRHATRVLTDNNVKCGVLFVDKVTLGYRTRPFLAPTKPSLWRRLRNWFS